MIKELLTPDSIDLNMKAVSKDEAIGELVDLLVRAHPGIDRKRLLESAVEREKRMSTGLGKGIAIPRCRSGNIGKTLCCIGVKRDGIEFEALDGLPVRIFFMVAAPKKTDESYVKILSRLCRLLSQETLKTDLLKARSSGEVLSLIVEEEKGFED